MTRLAVCEVCDRSQRHCTCRRERGLNIRMEVTIVFTSNTAWLEEIDGRRCQSPEDLLTDLEGMLESGELTTDEAITYLKDMQS